MRSEFGGRKEWREAKVPGRCNSLLYSYDSFGNAEHWPSFDPPRICPCGEPITYLSGGARTIRDHAGREHRVCSRCEAKHQGEAVAAARAANGTQ